MRILRYAKKIPTYDWLPGAKFDLVPEQEVDEEKMGPKLFDIIVSAVQKTDMDYVIIDRTESLLNRRVSPFPD